MVTTLAGNPGAGEDGRGGYSLDGTGTAASFSVLGGIAVDSNGNVYAADRTKVRKITPNGVVTTLAGSGFPGVINGKETAAAFYYPYGVAVDSSGNVYVSEPDAMMIRKITISQ